MGFDDAFVLSDQAAFSEMAATVTFAGGPVQAIISPLSSYQTNSDGSGGFTKIEGQRLEILTADLTAALNGAPLHTGFLAVVEGNSYRVVQIKMNGFTTTLILASTSGSSAQF
jgi:hypothetical protein